MTSRQTEVANPATLSADDHETDAGSLRVCVVSEGISMAPDEGIKKFATSIVQSLGSFAQVLGVSLSTQCDLPNVVSHRTNRLLLSPGLREKLRAFAPDVICYVPTASDTLFSYIRLKILKSYRPSATTILVALQPRHHSRLGQSIIRRLAPDLVLVQSRERALRIRRSGLSSGWIPSGVDIDRFHPVSDDEKRELRYKYGLPQDKFLVLHVGHISRQRNIDLLTEFQRRWQVVLVTGNSVGEDADLRSQLNDAGVIVFDQYLEAVQEIYQAADCYLFPVSSEMGSIETPLSILEAMACNLPVVSTRYGGLEDLLDTSESWTEDGLFLADEPHELQDMVAQVELNPGASTRNRILDYSWDSIATRLLDGPREINKLRRQNL